MPENARLRSQIQGLNSRNENVRRESMQALKQYEPAEWTGVTNDVVKSLISDLRQQLGKNHDGKAPMFRQEIATILGNIGHRAEPAIPQLMELLDDGIPDGVREASA